MKVFLEIDVRAGQITRPNIELLVIFSGFAVLLAIPMTLYFGLGWTYPDHYWAITGNPFGDWGIYYLDFLPTYIIITVLYERHNLTFYTLAKWLVVFMLGYWLFYDWTWQLLMGIFGKGVSMKSPFYFDIVIKAPPMFFFLIMAGIGFLMSLLLLALADSWWNIGFCVVYLIWVYGLGTVTAVTRMPDSFYIGWSVVMLPLLVIAFLLANNHDGFIKACQCPNFKIIG